MILGPQIEQIFHNKISDNNVTNVKRHKRVRTTLPDHVDCAITKSANCATLSPSLVITVFSGRGGGKRIEGIGRCGPSAVRPSSLVSSVITRKENFKVR